MSHGGWNTSTETNINENQGEKVNTICLGTVLSEAMAAFNFCYTVLLFYQKSRFEYLKNGKINSAPGNSHVI